MLLRLFVFAFVLLAVTGCGFYAPTIGKIQIDTDGSGKMKSAFIKESTGNPKADARYLLFVKNTFTKRVPNPKPNFSYYQPLVGDPKNDTGGVEVIRFPRVMPE